MDGTGHELHRHITLAPDRVLGRLTVEEPANLTFAIFDGDCSVVTKDVPDFAIVAGNPARFVRWRFDEETRARILASRWWDYDLSHIPHRDYADVHGMLDQIERIQPPKLEPRIFTYGQ